MCMHLFCGIYTRICLLHMEDAEADEHSEESAGDEDHEDNEKSKKNVKVGAWFVCHAHL